MTYTSVHENTYPFFWLDELAGIILNPEKNKVEKLTASDLTAIKERLPGEFSQISDRLKNQAFSLYKGDQIKVVAGQYDQAIRLLQQQALINLTQYPAQGMLQETGQLLLGGLNELLRGIRERYEDYLKEAAVPNPESDPLFKILCRLSVDQIAIILKAADDIKLVVARSFSQVLKSIVPFLSTERFKDVSWKSARSSTYKMEGSDKDVVIRALEALIDKIKAY